MTSASDPGGGAAGADRGGQAPHEPGTDSPPPAPGDSGSSGAQAAWIVLALFPSSRAAERTVALLPGAFRRQVRHGRASAFVVVGDEHGSFKLVQSRVVTAGGLTAAAMGMSASIMLGLYGLVSALRGVKTGAGAVRAHESHAGSGADRLRHLLDRAGERAAALVIGCPDEATARTVEAKAAGRATDHWRRSRTEFLAALDRLGSEYDWLRPAAGKPDPA